MLIKRYQVKKGIMRRFVFGDVFMLLLLSGYTQGESPTVTPPVGTIIGATRNVTFKQDMYEVDIYLGIPYAKPPVGELRFKKPEPFGVFTEPFNASDFGDSCPQVNFGMGTDNQSEDCLFLNVYVPRQPADTASGHAVMLFIHGGGFSMGNADLYHGEALASVGNVILVTINYRLGLLGFLDIDDGNSAGNFGLWDQRMALQWINGNIGAFGGDKDRVTLFGQSAGSISIAWQMLYPGNHNLFRGGITQSGALTVPGYYRENTIDAAKYAAENLNCSVRTMDEVFNCLKTASSDDIIQVFADAMTSLNASSMSRISVSPTVDGEFMKVLPTELLKKANAGQQSDQIDFFRSLKLINGVNGQEGANALPMLGQDDFENIQVNRDQMNNEQIPGAFHFKYGERELPTDVKRLIISAYTNWTNPDDPITLREQVTFLFGDIWANVPGLELSRVHCNASNVDSYFYKFDAVPLKRMAQIPSWIKSAVHGEELGPVFGYKADSQKLMNVPDYTHPASELELSERMMTFWSNFAKIGNPNGVSASNGSASLTWPKFNITSQAFIKINTAEGIGNFPFARQADLWTNLIPSILETSENINQDCPRQQGLTSAATSVGLGMVILTTIIHTLMMNFKVTITL